MLRSILSGAVALATLGLGACAINVNADETSIETLERFTPPTTGGAKPLYANMVEHNGVLYLAGTLGFKPGTRELGEGVEAQTALAIDGIAETLARAGADLSDVLQCTVYLADIADYGAMNGVYKPRFEDNPPARTALAVAGLPLGAEVEIACIAAAPDS